MGHTMTISHADGVKQPQYVHCPKCQHEWIAVYLPMDAGLAASILQAATKCQMCGEGPTRMGKYPHATPQGDPVAWLTGGDTGISSKTIWFVMMGRENTEPYWYPSPPKDPSDFGRCHRLLTVMPSWRARLPEVAAKHPEWSGLVEHWDELTTLYEDELVNGKKNKRGERMATKTYNRMKQLLGER